MANLRPYFLRAWDGAAPEAEVCQKPSLQVAQVHSEGQLAGIIVYYAYLPLRVDVLPFRELLKQVRRGNSCVRVDHLAALAILRVCLDAEANA